MTPNPVDALMPPGTSSQFNRSSTAPEVASLILAWTSAKVVAAGVSPTGPKSTVIGGDPSDNSMVRSGNPPS